MSELVQHSIVGAMIFVAGLYVARRSWLSLRGQSSGCGAGCGKCGSASEVMIEISDLRVIDEPKGRR